MFLCTYNGVSCKEKKGWLHWLNAFCIALQMDSVMSRLSWRPYLSDGRAIVAFQLQCLAGPMRLSSPSFSVPSGFSNFKALPIDETVSAVGACHGGRCHTHRLQLQSQAVACSCQGKWRPSDSLNDLLGNRMRYREGQLLSFQLDVLLMLLPRGHPNREITWVTHFCGLLSHNHW